MKHARTLHIFFQRNLQIEDVRTYTSFLQLSEYFSQLEYIKSKIHRWRQISKSKIVVHLLPPLWSKIDATFDLIDANAGVYLASAPIGNKLFLLYRYCTYITDKSGNTTIGFGPTFVTCLILDSIFLGALGNELSVLNLIINRTKLS